MKKENSKMLTPIEVAKYLRVSLRTVYRYLNSGRLKAYRLPAWRIKKEELDIFLKESSNT